MRNYNDLLGSSFSREKSYVRIVKNNVPIRQVAVVRYEVTLGEIEVIVSIKRNKLMKNFLGDTISHCINKSCHF